MAIGFEYQLGKITNTMKMEQFASSEQAANELEISMHAHQSDVFELCKMLEEERLKAEFAQNEMESRISATEQNMNLRTNKLINEASLITKQALENLSDHASHEMEMC